MEPRIIRAVRFARLAATFAVEDAQSDAHAIERVRQHLVMDNGQGDGSQNNGVIEVFYPAKAENFDSGSSGVEMLDPWDCCYDRVLVHRVVKDSDL